MRHVRMSALHIAHVDGAERAGVPAMRVDARGVREERGHRAGVVPRGVLSALRRHRWIWAGGVFLGRRFGRDEQAGRDSAAAEKGRVRSDGDMSRRILWITDRYPPAKGGMAVSCA